MSANPGCENRLNEGMRQFDIAGRITAVVETKNKAGYTPAPQFYEFKLFLPE